MIVTSQQQGLEQMMKDQTIGSIENSLLQLPCVWLEFFIAKFILLFYAVTDKAEA